MSDEFDHLLSKLPPVPVPFKHGAEGRIRTKPKPLASYNGKWIRKLPKVRDLVAAQDGYCGICGTRFFLLSESPIPNMHPTIDHVIPQSKDGRDEFNVIAVHSACNTAKADRLPTGCEMIWLDVVNSKI